MEGLESRVPGARDHAEGSAAYAFAAAVELGLDRERAEAVRELARLHEVGAVYLPAELLAKPEADLTPEERVRVESRFEAGRDLARGAALPDEICDWILLVGERFDGLGPAGLAGDIIPLESRIARAGCVCDAALSAPLDGGEDSAFARTRAAIDRLRSAAGAELDPAVVLALVAVLDRARAGA
jgi:HD-GYP domain-containing protein (c-di-GMP phosphodiesterase class II)